ncbi:hypothetical protein PHISCL_09770 [Aspergillus sclerotialis]|uniref:LPXTG-motif cell wall anchor domain protein n=1 Tax=Aspergillus sclerotialis TaxID=2070753 RepID=A0A3A2ZEZ2_9EURO|nr:hypothetical protein PHISCL_09770 [Aspergillus sclerotialis]
MWHWKDEAPLGSTIPTKSVSSLRSRRATDSAISAQQQWPETSGRMRGSLYPTNTTVSSRPYSQLSTEGLSNPTLGEIRTRKLWLRREEAVKVKEREEKMSTGEPRDERNSHVHSSPARAAATTSTTNYSSHSSSHLKSSRVQSSFDSPKIPRRKRALTAHHSSTIETPSPESSSPSYVSLYDRSRRSVPSLGLSNITARFPSSQPLSPALKKNRTSVYSDGANSPLSPNAPQPRERSVHIAQQAVRPDVKATMPSTVTDVEDRTLTGQSNHALNGVDKDQEQGPGTPTADARSKNEDIFLNIAKSDSVRRESLGRLEPRRSRYRFSNHSLRSPTSAEQTPSPDQLRFNNYDSPLYSNDLSPSVRYNSAAPSSASAHPLDDHTHSRYSAIGSSSRSTVGVPHSRFSRASPDTSPRSPAINPDRRSSLQDSRSYRHSTLSTIRSSRQPSASEATERARVDHERARQDGTESTLSTTAPSTVWDELEDLKSRIRKLELTGKLPPSSQEAMSSAVVERPRTAATTATTLSSSPKHDRRVSNPSAGSDVATTTSQIHPLLQSALAKGKDVLSREVYNALEMTVADALRLSSILGSGVPLSGNFSVANGYNSSDRQARRKADSVCRSLTELCLALSDEQLNKQRPTSHERDSNSYQQNGFDGMSPATTPSYQRSGSHEPEGTSRRRSTTTRAPSRLDTRRSSLANTAVPPSPLPDSKQTPSPSVEAPTSRLSRLSTSSRTRRLQTADDNEENGPPIRSLSRATTDISAATYTPRIPRQRISHEYRTSHSTIRPQQSQSPTSTSQTQQQQQTPQPRTPSISQSGIPFRRSYVTPASYTPATSRSSIQAGSRRYGLSSNFTPSPSDRTPAENTGVPRPSQPEPSQTRIIAPSNKVATSYTPIPQNRIRTNSLGARRFGMRQRPMSTVDDAVHTLDDSID